MTAAAFFCLHKTGTLRSRSLVQWCVRAVALATLVGLAAGCGASSSQVKGPDGQEWYAVKCRRSQSNCYEEAGEVCPNGYAVGDATQRQGAAVYASGGTLVGGTTFTGEMLIRCTHGSPSARRAEAARPAPVDDEGLAAIRRAPKVPELGATQGEANLLCKRQRGRAREVRGSVACAVGDALLFACHLDDQEVFDRCDAYFEGSDPVEVRDGMAKSLGTWDTKVRDGVRVFSWPGAGVSISVYEPGVRVTTTKPISRTKPPPSK